jgi:hypothetical protein
MLYLGNSVFYGKINNKHYKTELIMPTETQRNFKKQMKEIKNDLDNKANDSFYSYIEKDHIRNYYDSKNSRQIIAKISFGSIISLLLIVYSLYTWIKPVLESPPAQNIKNISISNSGLNQSKTTELEDIRLYLMKIYNYDIEFQEFLRYSSNNFKNTMEGNYDESVYIKDLNTDIDKILNVLLSLNSEVPHGFILYNNIILQKYTLISNQLKYCLEIVNTRDRSILKKLNDNNLILTDLYNKQKDEMKNAFQNLGIIYEENENGITFHY